MRRSSTSCPCGPELRGRTPLRRPAGAAPATGSTRTENQPPLPDELLADLGAALGHAALELNRYPDRDAVALRTDLAAYLSRRAATGRAGAGVGGQRLERGLQQILQAFGGRADGAGLHAVVLDAPIISAGTGTALGRRPRRDDFTIDAAGAAAGARGAPGRRLRDQPEQPDGTAVALETIEDLYEATQGVLVVDEAYEEFARAGTPSALTLLPGGRG